MSASSTKQDDTSHFCCLLILCITSINNGYTQDSIPSSLPKGKWLNNRGPFDPRPYDNTLFGSLLFTDNYFKWKNKLWIDKGISFGGYVSGNTQLGSQGGPTHQISESLILFTWEPVRKARSAGRLVVGFAYDLTFGKPTTRGFADNQKLIETPNDLDTDPDQTFATLGLLHWNMNGEPDPMVDGLFERVNFMLLLTLARHATLMMTGGFSWPGLWQQPVEHNGLEIMILDLGLTRYTGKHHFTFQ
jgi:hypothetical protein